MALNFAANLSYLFLDRPFPVRFAAAAAAGFRGVEFHFPYGEPAEQVADWARRAGVQVVLFNLPPGDWAAGERGIACHPARMAEFQEGVGRALEYARALGCPRVNRLAGLRPAAVPEDRALETLAENLRFAAAVLGREGIRLLLEPINSRDMPGFLINTSRQALALMDRVASNNLFLQFDLYHAQVMEGDLARTLEAQLPRIGHLQVADNPGRHEPGTGEIHYPFLFRHLERLGYAGWIGCEYVPLTATEAGLGWLAPWR